MNSKKTIKPTRVNIEKLPKSIVEIAVEVGADDFGQQREKAIESLSQKVKIDGFRQGKIPEAVLIKNVGEFSILEEMARHAIEQTYPEIIISEKLDIIGQPDITITKIASGNPLEFKVKTSVFPSITLGDYKKIAKEQNKKKQDTNATDDEVKESLEKIRKNIAYTNKAKELQSKNEPLPETAPKLEDSELPELNDAFAQSVGDFKNLEELKDKIKETLIEEKKLRSKEKNRLSIIEETVKESTMDIPDILVEHELNKMMAQFGADIEKMGLNKEDYLKHLKKSEEEIRNGWKEEAEKNAKIQLVLNEIAVKESIKPEELEIEKEAEHILKHYPEAKEENVRIYVSSMLSNEKVFNFLEAL